MRNIKVSKKGNLMILEIDTAAEAWESASGKSLNVASTEGNISVPEFPELKLGINIYKSNPNRPTKGK